VNRFELPVGWRAIDVYAASTVSLWRPDMAATWAELDLLGVAASRNVLDRQLQQLDPAASARKKIGGLIRQGEGLLVQELEGPMQLFLQEHPELIEPAYKNVLRKLPFGKRDTDFVLQDHAGEFLLVEIEAPKRRLFRPSDGQPHEELIHAQKQVFDWWRYIEDNLSTVRNELGLTGITARPRALIVIGRSTSLTDADRRNLQVLNDSNPKLSIMTYDDLFANAGAVAANLLGPLWNPGGDAQVYYLPARG
jgi:hypothetical protein